MIDRDTVGKIMDAANIVEVVSDFVTLRKAGVNYKGLCPFHNEKTPSFVVSPAKGYCKCFSCGKGGNVVHFLMEHEQISYPEALRWLAKKYNIEIQERELTPEERRAQNERESLFLVNEWARDYFQNILFTHPDGQAIGMAYFHSRGFRDDIIKKFQLGFCLPLRDGLAQEALKKGYNRDYLFKTGLCLQNEQGQLRDRYRGRVIFPVHTLSGKVVAFGGRVLKTDDKVAKYVNSPESEIYHKSNELYGIYFAKQAIVKQNRCFLVEGYTDVISMHQSGVENVVASSGTSLTQGQIRLIHRFTNNITVLYDGDMAGIKASLRGIDMLLEEGLNIKVLLLPDNDDPDSFARKHNAQEYCEYIDKHQVDFIRFKTNILLKDSENNPMQRAQVIADIVKSISVIPDAILRSIYIKECSQVMKVEEGLLVDEVIKMKRSRNEEQQKRLQRENEAKARQNGGTIPSSPSTSNEQSTTVANDVSANLIQQNNTIESKEEALLIQAIVRYGEMTAGCMEDENGNEIEVSVIEYIADELQADNLAFRNPLYQRMLEEAIAHVHDKGFQAKNYFLNHTDINISKHAFDLYSDRYQLSRVYSNDETFKQDEQRLDEMIPHLLIDFKFAILSERKKAIMQELHQMAANQDLNNYENKMRELINVQEAERNLAKITARVINN